MIFKENVASYIIGGISFIPEYGDDYPPYIYGSRYKFISEDYIKDNFIFYNNSAYLDNETSNSY